MDAKIINLSPINSSEISEFRKLVINYVGKYYDEINSKKQVCIFTPASSKGISISMNPLKAPPEGMEREDEVQAIDAVADTIANILGYNTDKGRGAEVKAYLYLLLRAIWKRGEEVSRFDKLANYILNDAD